MCIEIAISAYRWYFAAFKITNWHESLTTIIPLSAQLKESKFKIYKITVLIHKNVFYHNINNFISHYPHINEIKSNKINNDKSAKWKKMHKIKSYIRITNYQQNYKKHKNIRNKLRCISTGRHIYFI